MTWWAIGAGLLAGVATAFMGNPAAVLMACAAIYLVAAVAARPNAAWIGFAASIPVIGLGYALHLPWLPLVLIGVASVTLVVIGAIRGSWRRPDNRLQLAGILVFSAIAVGVVLLNPLAAGLLAIVALLGHAAWDIWHHIRRAVVARSYAEFCAVLDIVLAVVVAVMLVVNGVVRGG